MLSSGRRHNSAKRLRPVAGMSRSGTNRRLALSHSPKPVHASNSSTVMVLAAATRARQGDANSLDIGGRPNTRKVRATCSEALVGRMHRTHKTLAGLPAETRSPEAQDWSTPVVTSSLTGPANQVISPAEGCGLM
jgi:hypothetical protein